MSLSLLSNKEWRLYATSRTLWSSKTRLLRSISLIRLAGITEQFYKNGKSGIKIIFLKVDLYSFVYFSERSCCKSSYSHHRIPIPNEAQRRNVPSRKISPAVADPCVIVCASHVTNPLHGDWLGGGAQAFWLTLFVRFSWGGRKRGRDTLNETKHMKKNPDWKKFRSPGWQSAFLFKTFS